MLKKTIWAVVGAIGCAIGAVCLAANMPLGSSWV